MFHVTGPDWADAVCVGSWDIFTEAHEGTSVGQDAVQFAKNLCSQCPVFAQCEAYARATKPSTGVWAGRRWGPGPDAGAMTGQPLSA